MSKDWKGNKNSVFKTLGASNHTDKERESLDFYATDSVAIDKLASAYHIPHYVWECACGAGHLSNRLMDLGHKVYSSDIVDRGFGIVKDFLDSPLPQCEDQSDLCILTNPPYKCFDTETECYTKRGWLRYDQLNETDEILSIEPHTQMLEWSGINAIIIREKGENERMFHFHKSHMDIMVTNGHRMFCYNKTDGKLAILNGDLVKSEKINATHYIPRKGYKWDGEDKEYFILPAINGMRYAQPTYKEEIAIHMDDWLDFFGLWLSDGYCRHTLNSQGNYRKTVGIKQLASNKERIRKALDKLPFAYKEKIDNYNRDSECINFEINDEQLWSYLIQFGKSHEKYIPDEIKNLSQRQLTIFIKSYHDGDGSMLKDGSVLVYRSISKRLIEDVQEILLKLGYLSHITKSDYNTQTLYQIYASENSIYSNIYFPANRSGQCEVEYTGKVWCVNLKKNGVFLLRRNGKEFFCGNCATEFVEHAMEILPKGAPAIMLLKTTALEGKGRWERLYSKGYLKAVYQFSERLLCAKNGDFDTMIKGGGSAVAYSWFIFANDGKNDPPTIHWI